MKICHITTAHPYNDTRIFFKECSFLVKKGYEVHLIVPCAQEIDESIVIVHGIKKSNSRLIRMTKTVFSAYQKAKQIKAELYHFHDPELVLIGLLLKLQGKKVIYDIHEDVPEQIKSKEWIIRPIRNFISSFYKLIEEFCAVRFDAVITATPYIHKRFQTIGCKAVNINNYPLLTELYSTEKHKVNKQFCCYIGGINHIRGITEMVKAIGKTNAKLLLVGNFDMEDCRKNVTVLPGWQRVEELGFKNRNEVKEVLSESFVGLVLFHPEPNHINAQPNKMFEYMSAGIPIIASNFPLWKEIIESNNCGICVDPLNPNAIAEAIKWLQSHPIEAECMGKNGRKVVESNYNWENEVKKLFSTYSKILSIKS